MLPSPQFPFSRLMVRLLATALLVSVASGAAAKPKLSIGKAKWRNGHLLVSGSGPKSMKAASVELYDSSGRLLGTQAAQGRRFSFSLTPDRAELLCAVQVKAGGLTTTRPIAGAPNKDCGKAPQCRILSPTPGAAALTVGTEVSFSASAKLKDKKAGPLQLEWDFGGGAMGEDPTPDRIVQAYRKPDTETATVRFVRDNSRYRVRFSATDAKKRRCEDSVEVVVGTAPAGLPDQVAEPPAPALGSQLSGIKDDYVVLPFEDWTMQMDSDAAFMPNIYNATSPSIHNLRAVVYQKALQPVVLGTDKIQLKYSAGSNPADPVGSGSINSTSQNWPLNDDIKVFSPMLTATVQKSQLWEKYTGRADDEKSDSYKPHFWAAFGSNYPFNGVPESARPYPDEGYLIGPGKQNDPEANGSFMPGKADPYKANDPQPFGSYNDKEGLHEVKMLPLSDVDDQGRINPFPLFRVQAVKDDQVKATADAVMTNGRDFHCRGCHARGKIAANPNAPHTKAAFASTPAGHMQTGPLTPIDKPEFFEPENDSIYAQEHAAALNFSSLHDFYDGYTFLKFMQYGSKADMYSPTFLTDKVNVDGPVQCTGCHATPQRFVNFGVGPDTWWDGGDHDPASMDYDPNYTVAMHRFHGELQWKDESKSDIKRKTSGIYERWDWKTKGANNTSDTSLFPIFDKETGQQLPMEENCLKCHSGEREQHYRDRMATAGVTCYDCHGDMLAVGEAYPNDYLNHKNKLGSTDLKDYRLAWFDNPDCGSCHTGDGNVGADQSGGFFSAGVMKQAFDPSDPSATTRPVDKADPNGRRFSAAPVKNYQTDITTSLMTMDSNMEYIYTDVTRTFDAPLFRFGRDRHGDVPCAACHGAAHAIWPNRDPNANDNVTALQLQGHTGTLLECNVCHTTESFAKLEDLDGGANFSGDATAGILGGPHDLHPVNDPYWWKDAKDATDTNADGTTAGGWHNNYAKLPGMKGEDQCAACHGKDHKGTRLSKTPVDRTFDFSDFKFGPLSKVGFKSRVIQVKAGTPIGCDTCHDLPTSFYCSPSTSQPRGTPSCPTP
ncbi:MAG: cytochrome C [Methylococcaceae bacterium]|nr:cytochrome C [Methylococcaceae bacterium]